MVSSASGICAMPVPRHCEWCFDGHLGSKFSCLCCFPLVTFAPTHYLMSVVEGAVRSAFVAQSTSGWPGTRETQLAFIELLSPDIKQGIGFRDWPTLGDTLNTFAHMADDKKELRVALKEPPFSLDPSVAGSEPLLNPSRPSSLTRPTRRTRPKARRAGHLHP